MRVGRNIGVGMPWWLAIPAYLVWVSVLVAYAAVWLLATLAIAGVRLARRGCAPRPPSSPGC